MAGREAVGYHLAGVLMKAPVVIMSWIHHTPYFRYMLLIHFIATDDKEQCCLPSKLYKECLLFLCCFCLFVSDLVSTD